MISHRQRDVLAIFLRSAIFLIRKGALRPPAGSAAPARPGGVRGPWGTQYYGITTRWRRRGPLPRGGGQACRRLQPPQAKQMRGQNQQHIISGQESSSTRPATTRQRRRCGRRTRARRGPRFRRPARRYSGPFEARNADHAAPFVRLSARRLKKTAQRDRLPAQRSISPCPRAAQVAEPDDVDEKLLRRWRVGAGPRVAPTARGTAQYTARVPRHNSSEATSSTPSPPPPARRPPVPRTMTAGAR